MIPIALALGTALVATLALMPLHIGAIRRLGVRQIVRRQGPERHLRKEGTPSMGGAAFVSVAAVVGLVLGHGEPLMVTAIGLTLFFAAMGAADDLGKVLRHGALGLRARTKLLFGVAAGVVLAWLAAGPLGLGTGLRLPFSGALVELSFPLYTLLVVLVVTGTTNAVNLTDGLDGLAAGLAILALGFYAALSFADGAVALGLYAVALCGALVGFLYFNLHPARVFMGDTGALALGAALAGLAVLTRSELLLPVVGLVFVVEVVSVMVQVASFRLLGRRLLRMSPLHHHFELLGWSEEQVVRRFWLAGLLAALVGYVAWW
jgi:phospho-N-acetylmuramoyl-pentapeptide-transferase